MDNCNDYVNFNAFQIHILQDYIKSCGILSLDDENKLLLAFIDEHSKAIRKYYCTMVCYKRGTCDLWDEITEKNK